MCYDEVVATCRVYETIGARALDAAQRLTALVEAGGRGLKVECPHMDAARCDAQSALRCEDERRI
jgi:hypothetical protein